MTTAPGSEALYRPPFYQVIKMKFSAALFHQTTDDVRARIGDRFNPSTNYPAYDGVISVPAAIVPELIDYLSAATPNDRGEIPLRMAGWKKTSSNGRTYLSIAISEDYKTQKAIEANRTAAPGPSPVAAAAQQLATAFSGHAVPADDVPF